MRRHLNNSPIPRGTVRCPIRLWVGIVFLLLLSACRKEAQPDAPARTFPLAEACDSLYRAGRAYQRQQEYGQAIDCFHRCLSLRTTALDSLELLALQQPLTSSMVQLVNVYQSAGQPDACATYLDSLVSSPSPVIDSCYLRDLLSVTAYALSRTERMAEAERYVTRAMQLPLWQPTCERLFRDYAYAAAVYFSNPSHEEQVIHYCRQALEQARLCKNASGRQYVLSMLGTLFKRTGRIDEAIVLFEQSFEEAHRLQDRLGEVNAYNALTELLLYWGLEEQADHFSRRGIGLMESTLHGEESQSLNPTIIAQLYFNRGHVMDNMQQSDSALYYGHRAEQYVKDLPYNSGQADADLFIGGLESRPSSPSTHSAARRRLQRAASLGTCRTRAHAYYLLARLAQEQADPHRCELYLDSMYTQLHTSVSPFYIDGAYEFGLDHYLQTNNLPMVRRYAAACRDEHRFNSDLQTLHHVTDIVVRQQTNIKEAQLQLVQQKMREKILLLGIIIAFVSLLLVTSIIVIIDRRRIYRTRQKLVELKLNNLIDTHNRVLNNLEQEQRHTTRLEKQLNEVLDDLSQRSHLEASSLLSYRESGNMNQFEYRFSLLYPCFLPNLRLAVPDITEREILFCMLIALRQSSYQISQMMDITPRSVNMMRWRLRKKFHLTSSQDSLDEAVLNLLSPDADNPDEQG